MADEEVVFEQLSVCIQQMLWSDVVGTLEKLKLWSKHLDNRYGHFLSLSGTSQNSGFCSGF